MAVAPYPLSGLPRVPRSAARSLPRPPLQARERCLAVAVQLLGARPSLRLRGYDADAGQMWELAGVVLSILPPWGPQPLQLRVPNALARVLVDRVLGGDGDLGHDGRALDDLSLGAFGYLAARLAAALDDYAVTAVRRCDESDTPPEGVALLLELSMSGTTACLGLSLPDRGWPPAPPARMPLALPPPLAPLPIALSAIGASGILPLSQLVGMGHGDVVVFDSYGLRRTPDGMLDGHVQLRPATGGCGIWHARWTKEGLMIEDTERSGEDVAETAETGRGPAEDLPITVTMEVARVSVPLAQLLALGPGDVLPCGKPVGAEVRLMTSGREVARGELVDVDGELGVRVTALPTAAG